MIIEGVWDMPRWRGGAHMPDDQPDITDEVLAGLAPAIRSVLEQAIRKQTDTVREGADPILSELREIAREMRAVGERAARLETRQDEQDRRTAEFWARQWPEAQAAVARVAAESDVRMERLEKRLAAKIAEHRAHVDAQFAELRTDVVRIGATRGALYEAGAVLCRTAADAVRILIERPAALGMVLAALVVLAGLAALGAGGALQAAWGDLSMRVDRGEVTAP